MEKLKGKSGAEAVGYLIGVYRRHHLPAGICRADGPQCSARRVLPGNSGADVLADFLDCLRHPRSQSHLFK